jgi:hypothetical protein
MNTRFKTSLDGTWQFWVDPAADLCSHNLPERQALSIQVPAPWQAQSDDLRLYSGTAWYRRNLVIPENWLGNRRVILGIGAADYHTQVWVNDQMAGENEGGYLPFEFDITGLVQRGENTLAIRIDDPPGIFPEVPHGKQGWYGPLSGIWQTVWLESRSALHLRSLQLDPQPSTGQVGVDICLSAPASNSYTIEARLVDPFGLQVAVLQAAPKTGAERSKLQLAAPEPFLWSPETPHLYTLEVILKEGQIVLDSLSKTFGFRTIETRDGRMYLNGKLFYMRGVLDQDYYPDTIYTSPSTEYLEDQICKAKELGLNLMRCHIKVADPRYYEAADRLGMLIWTELPNWSTLTEQAGRRGRDLMQGFVERDGHHPSIIIWTIINEDWGTDLVAEPSHRRWLKETFHWLKALDPTRLVVDNSACDPNFHIQTDLEDYHFYRSIPDHRKEWDEFVDAFSRRAPFTFCPNGDSVRTGREPLLVSEFGNWGMPDIEKLKDDLGRDPWWFDTGFEWSDAVVFPQGVRGRFSNLGLKQVFGSWQAFVEATQWQQFLAMKYQIEAMRRRPQISGYVITELTDVHWECNGLLDMCRNPKVYHDKFASINAATVIIPEWERVGYWEGEEVCVGLSLSHSEGKLLKGAELRWMLESGSVISTAAGRVSLPDIEPGEVRQVGMAHFVAPCVEQASTWSLQLELLSASGTLIAVNSLELAIYPLPAGNLDIVVYTPDKALRQPLKRLGCRLVSEPAAAQVTVAAKTDPALQEHLQKGGRLLILAGRNGEEGTVIPGVKLAAREGTPWDGDWASTFSWVDRKGHFSALPGGALIDHSFDRIIPNYVLLGWRDWEFPKMVQAGTVVGWVHKPAALIATRWYGQGRALCCAFHLDDPALAEDPTALALLESLLRQAAA